MVFDPPQDRIYPTRPRNGRLMTACTQPGCTGTIVDDYCDVCGSPAGAAPFIPAGAAASAPSTALAGGPGLTAGRQRSGVPPAPRNGRLMTACMQPGCTGTIVDDYCDVCGSPAGAPPFIPAGAAARQPNLAEEERPIQPIPRVMATAPSSTQDTAAPAMTDPGAPGIEKVDEERVDPAAAHQELSMALGGSPSILDMELMIASIRSGTGKVDAEKADPVAADTEQVDTEIAALTATQPVDTEQADSTAADTKKTEAAPPGPDNPDTVETPPVGAALSGGRQPLPQPPEQEVHAPAPDQTPVDKKRFGFLALAAAVLAALLVGAFFIASRDGSGVTAQSVATVTATVTLPVSKSPSEPSDEPTDTGSGSAAKETIQLEDLAASARPFEAVRIQGTYRGGAGSFLRVQRWEGGRWLDFPLPTKTDQSGRFTTQAEFGQPGRYWLRVLDPDSGVASKTFVVVIKG